VSAVSYEDKTLCSQFEESW